MEFNQFNLSLLNSTFEPGMIEIDPYGFLKDYAVMQLNKTIVICLLIIAYSWVFFTVVIPIIKATIQTTNWYSEHPKEGERVIRFLSNLPLEIEAISVLFLIGFAYLQGYFQGVHKLWVFVPIAVLIFREFYTGFYRWVAPWIVQRWAISYLKGKMLNDKLRGRK